MSALGDALRRAELPPSAAAMERTIFAATGPDRRPDRRARRSWWRRPWLRPALAATLVVVAVLVATGAGQSAISWAGDLIGIGEVGGPPTLEQRPHNVSPQGKQVVIGTGEAPDGTRYEVVAYTTNSPVGGNHPDAPCLFIDFPGIGPPPLACVATCFRLPGRIWR